MLSRLRRRLSGASQALRPPELDFKALHLPRMRLSDLHAPEIDWSRLGAQLGREGPRARALWPTLFAAASAGAAFWWWNQWARGQAETDDQVRREAETAAQGTTAFPIAPDAPVQGAGVDLEPVTEAARAADASVSPASDALPVAGRA